MTNKLKEKIEEAKKEIQAEHDLYLPMAKEAEGTLGHLREAVAPNKVELTQECSNASFSYVGALDCFDSFGFWKNAWRLLFRHPEVPTICRIVCTIVASPGKWYIVGDNTAYLTLAELLETKAKTIAQDTLDLEHRWKMENKQ